MPSWQARCAGAAVRVIVRRRQWGDELTLTRRARRVFGAPRIFQWLRTRGLRIESVAGPSVNGEWVLPRRSQNGVLLYVHGGGFVSCSAATHRPITAALARWTERQVFSLNYRLAPEHRFPAALDDVVAAYRWLLAQGIPSTAIVMAGDSAGGNLVLGGLVRMRDSGLPLPASAACFSPWTDLTATGESIHGNDGRCAMFRPENMTDFATCYLGGASPSDPAASPAFARLGQLPPLLLQVGSTELLLDDARRVHESIQRAGGTSEFVVFDDVFHCWQMLDGVVPEARSALRQAAMFLNRADGTLLHPLRPARDPAVLFLGQGSAGSDSRGPLALDWANLPDGRGGVHARSTDGSPLC